MCVTPASADCSDFIIGLVGTLIKKHLESCDLREVGLNVVLMVSGNLCQ